MLERARCSRWAPAGRRSSPRWTTLHGATSIATHGRDRDEALGPRRPTPSPTPTSSANGHRDVGDVVAPHRRLGEHDQQREHEPHRDREPRRPRGVRRRRRWARPGSSARRPRARQRQHDHQERVTTPAASSGQVALDERRHELVEVRGDRPVGDRVGVVADVLVVDAAEAPRRRHEQHHDDRDHRDRDDVADPAAQQHPERGRDEPGDHEQALDRERGAGEDADDEGRGAVDGFAPVDDRRQRGRRP